SVKNTPSTASTATGQLEASGGGRESGVIGVSLGTAGRSRTRTALFKCAPSGTRRAARLGRRLLGRSGHNPSFYCVAISATHPAEAKRGLPTVSFPCAAR